MLRVLGAIHSAGHATCVPMCCSMMLDVTLMHMPWRKTGLAPHSASHGCMLGRMPCGYMALSSIPKLINLKDFCICVEMPVFVSCGKWASTVEHPVGRPLESLE